MFSMSQFLCLYLLISWYIFNKNIFLKSLPIFRNIYIYNSIIRNIWPYSISKIYKKILLEICKENKTNVYIHWKTSKYKTKFSSFHYCMNLNQNSDYKFIIENWKFWYISTWFVVFNFLSAKYNILFHSMFWKLNCPLGIITRQGFLY